MIKQYFNSGVELKDLTFECVFIKNICNADLQNIVFKETLD